MNKFILITFCVLLNSTAFAGDYVCSDKDGNITAKYYSVDGEDLDKRADCIKITRDKFLSLISINKIDKSVIGTNDQKIVELSAAEIKAIEDAKQAVVDAQKAKIDALKLKLKGLGLDDEEISLLLDSGI